MHSFCSFSHVYFVVPSWFNFSCRYSLFAFGLFSHYHIPDSEEKRLCVLMIASEKKTVQGIQNMKSNVNKITKQNTFTMKETFITVSIIFFSLLLYFIQSCWYYLHVDLYRKMISTVQFSRFICKSLFNICFVVLTVRIYVPSYLISSMDFVTSFCASRPLREQFSASFLMLLLFL